MATQSPSLPTLLRQVLSHQLSQCSDKQLLERFTQAKDESAFAAILDRHGAMVLRLCRRLLSDAHLADDVLQATFLVLARKARSIRRRDSLAGWLYGVAQRLARQARLVEAARSRRERRAAGGRAESITSDAGWDELLRILDEELQRMPERHRLPLLLCYLEGRTQDEAAKLLDLSLRTLRRRLEAGRVSLRARMARRGVTLGAALFAGFLAPSAVRATLTAELRRTVLTTAMSGINGITIPASILMLVNGGMRMATIGKITFWLAVTVATGGALAGVIWQTGLALEPAANAEQAQKTIPSAEPRPQKAAKEPVILRDRFNDALPHGAVGRLGTVAFRHGRITLGGSLAFSPDGKHLVSTGGGWVRRWDLETGAATASYGDGWRQDGSNGTTLVTDDGKLARICHHITQPGGGKTMQCTEYNLESGKERTYRLDFPKDGDAHQMPPILSPNGKIYAELNHSGNLTLWNAAGGTVTHQLKKSAGPYTAVAFPPDGKTIVVGDDAHTFRVFDLATGLEQRSFAIDNANGVGLMAISPDGKWLASVGKKKQENTWIKADDRFIRLWNLQNGTVTRTIDFPEDGATESLEFTLDSRTLIAGILDRKSVRSTMVRTWDVSSGKPGRAWADDPTIGSTTAVSPDCKTLATMNQAGVIRLWGMQTGKEKRPLDAIPDGLKAVCWADAKTILTVGGDLIVRNWDAATGKRLGSPRALQRKQQYPMFAAGGKLLVTSFTQDDDSILVRVYDPSNGKLILEQPGYWAAFSPNGKRAATGGNNESIRIIDVDTGKRIHTIAPEAEENTSKPPFAHPLGFTSDGRSLVVLSAAAESKTLSTWDVLTGDQKSSWDLMKKELLKNPAERHKYSMEGIQAVAVSPNGNTVAFSLLKDGPTDRHGNLLDPFDRIVILETTSGKILHQIDVEEGYDGYFESLSFSPDGKLLAAGGRWTLRLWNVETGKNAGKFEGHRGNVQSLAFSPDGKRLASASEDSTVLVWGVAK